TGSWSPGPKVATTRTRTPSGAEGTETGSRAVGDSARARPPSEAIATAIPARRPTTVRRAQFAGMPRIPEGEGVWGHGARRRAHSVAWQQAVELSRLEVVQDRLHRDPLVDAEDPLPRLLRQGDDRLGGIRPAAVVQRDHLPARVEDRRA